LFDAGAVPAGHGSKLAKVLGEAVPQRPEPPSDPVHRAVVEQVAKLLETDRDVRADVEDAVHQMRVTIRQIRSLLYEQGFTIGGARNKLQGEEARSDVSQSQQIVKQLRIELEDILRILRR